MSGLFQLKLLYKKKGGPKTPSGRFGNCPITWNFLCGGSFFRTCMEQEAGASSTTGSGAGASSTTGSGAGASSTTGSTTGSGAGAGAAGAGFLPPIRSPNLDIAFIEYF